MNADVLGGPIVGVRRYAWEILPHLPSGEVRPIAPRLPRRRPRGLRLAWEQTVLPARLRGRLLWSPSGSGPLVVRHQVVTVHDLAVLDHPEWFNPGLARWVRFALPRLLHRAHHVIAISEFTRSRILACTALAPGRVTTIHHGVSQRFAPQPPEAITAMRRRLGLGDRPYLLALGTIEPRKNLARVLSAWAAVQSHAPEAVLVVAGMLGSGKYFATGGVAPIRHRTRLLGHVPDEELPALYSGALCSVYVSLYEGFGWPPLESMACGTPVLTSDHPAVSEVVADAAVRVDARDVAAISAGLARLLGSDAARQECAVRGLLRARDFDWTRAAGETWSVLQRFA